MRTAITIVDPETDHHTTVSCDGDVVFIKDNNGSIVNLPTDMLDEVIDAINELVNDQ